MSFDERTERAVEDLLNRVSNNEAAESYLRSVNELLHNTAHWTYIFDTTTAAYWRHASLVWLSLWHAALAPTVTATQAAVCVGLTARRKKAAPSVRKNTLPARLRQKLKLLSFSILKEIGRRRGGRETNNKGGRPAKTLLVNRPSASPFERTRSKALPLAQSV